MTAEPTIREAIVRKPTGKTRLYIFGAAAILLIVGALFSESLYPCDPYLQNLDAALQQPSAAHIFGTDRYGRDMLSRVIAGSRASIFSTFLLVAIITVVGTAVGVFCGWARGRADDLLMRGSDLCLAFPGLVFALAVAGVLGGGLHNAVLALAAISWPKYARIARSQTLAVRETTYLKAAMLAGCSTTQLIVKHILPNIAGPILVTAMLDIGTIFGRRGAGLYGPEDEGQVSGMEELLRYDRVTIAYNGAPVVHDVSFSLREGEILGVVGESGSGKSTLLKAAMGLLGPGGVVTRGDIWFKGRNLPDLPEEELRRLSGAELAMIFQDTGASFCPIRSVGAQLFEAVSAHETISETDFREKAAALLQKLRFENAARILESYPFELSGGMMQRVGVAAAMLLNPAVLLADEPTSALDVSVQKQAVEEMLLIRELCHTSIVIVTHNIGVVRAMADRVVVMKDGRIVESGDTRDVLEHPVQEYTKKLMAAVPKLRRNV